MAAIELVAGDTGTVLVATVRKSSDKSVVDLTGATVRLKYTIDGGALATKTMTVTDAANGKAEYQFTTGELTAAADGESTMRAEVELTDSGGKVTTQLVPMNLPIRAKV